MICVGLFPAYCWFVLYAIWIWMVVDMQPASARNSAQALPAKANTAFKPAGMQAADCKPGQRPIQP